VCVIVAVVASASEDRGLPTVHRLTPNAHVHGHRHTRTRTQTQTRTFVSFWRLVVHILTFWRSVVHTLLLLLSISLIIIMRVSEQSEAEDMLFFDSAAYEDGVEASAADSLVRPGTSAVYR
jgi:hypothetical protein